MRRFGVDRVLLLQLMIVVLMVAPVGGAAYYGWMKYQQFQGLLADIEPRYARLLGLLARQNDLQSLGLRVNEHLAQLAFPASLDTAKAGNEAQQRIRSLFTESRLEIISSQVLPPKQETDFDRIQINLRAEGDITALRTALSKIEEMTPIMIADNLALQTIGVVRPASQQKLSAQLTITMFRKRK